MNLLRSTKLICGKIFQRLFLLTHKLSRSKIVKSTSWEIEADATEVKYFGLIMSINYPLYWLIWYQAHNDTLDIILRLGATSLCLGLLLKNHWPLKLLKYFSTYWYFSLTFCLPFFFTFMTLKYHGSAVWLMNCMSALFFSLIVTHMAGFLLTTTIGIALGGFAFSLCLPPFQLNLGTVDLYSILWTFFAAIIIGSLFTHKKDKAYQEKLQAMEALGASIAHELRTPLRSISSSAKGLKKYMPVLLSAYQQTRQIDPQIKKIPALHLDGLKGAADTIGNEATGAFTFIDMLLVKLKEPSSSPSALQKHSISYTIFKAIQRYPFQVDERDLCHVMVSNDFIYHGNELLIVHVLFNLIKNALYHIQAAGHGEIYIWLETGKHENYLHFKDTGPGIPAHRLPYLFRRFYSRTYHGTGIGLAFCKMVMEELGGNITCYSKEKEYTEFILVFPK
jgi:signal transduction histidine kinase